MRVCASTRLVRRVKGGKRFQPLCRQGTRTKLNLTARRGKDPVGEGQRGHAYALFRFQFLERDSVFPAPRKRLLDQIVDAVPEAGVLTENTSVPPSVLALYSSILPG